jgi:hypothetical protein
MLESTEPLNNSKKVIIMKESEMTKKPCNTSSKKANKTNHGKMEVELEKEKSKRVITNTKQWNFLESDLEPMNQLNLIKQIMELVKGIGQDSSGQDCSSESFDTNLQHKIVFIKQQISNKIYGYRNQDLLKSKYDESKFVDFAKILEMMLVNDLKCYYCNNPVLVLYEYVREPKQWTVERIDNKFGHNKDNIEIACLNCNLHRRTMHHERYLFTKNLNIIKAIG